MGTGTEDAKTAGPPRFRIRASLALPVAAALWAAGVFVADAFTPPDVVNSGLYVVVVLLAGRFCRARDLWLICAGCVVLMAVGQVLSPHPWTTRRVAVTAYIGAFNTLVSVVVLVVATSLILRNRAAETALRRAQSDLARVSRVTVMGELAAAIAHEVNQPIAGVVANAGACQRWLDADTPNVEKARAAASRIERDGTRAADILQRVRAVFVRGEPEWARVDLNALVRDTLALIGPEAARYAVTLRTNLAPDLPAVAGDPVLLQQVIVNLVANGVDAVKALDGGRQLVLTSERAPEGKVRISVADNGVGLPAGGAEKLFDAFFTTKPQGTGMGLSISRSIIEAHDGALEARPNTPRGAVFCFTLPAAHGAPAGPGIIPAV